MELTAGIVIADRFRLVRPLGQGGMGAVWLAQHIGLDIPCAVKLIHAEAAQSPELRARFEREAKAAAQIRSPHVVQILDHGVWQEAPYIAMELLEGEDLGQRLRHRNVLAPHETLALAVQVGRALGKAHAAGLVHRDLKPANIFLVRDEDREIAKVLDFGVAKVKETGLDGNTKTGMVLGTPFYMSPEQARGSRDVDHRSDLWALAVVVYRCVTGQLPFRGAALGDLFVKIIVEPLPVPSEVAGSNAVPPGFDAWWARAAARDPAQRFQTAKELSDALGVALGVTVRDGVEVGSRLAAHETGTHARALAPAPLVEPPSPFPRPPAHPQAAPNPGLLPSPDLGHELAESPPAGAWEDAAASEGPTMALPPPGTLEPAFHEGASGHDSRPRPRPPAEAPPMPPPSSAPTPLQQSISVRAPPPSGHDGGRPPKPPGRRAVAATAVVAALALVAAAFFAWSFHEEPQAAPDPGLLQRAAATGELPQPPVVSPPAPAILEPPSQAATAAVAPTPAVVTPAASTGPTAAAAPETPDASVTVVAAPRAPAAVPAKGPSTPKPKPKTDFGF